MNAKINQLVKTLLQKNSLEDCSLPELQQFADRHPYFGAAQLLLTKKLQNENHEQYQEQLQKTFLFFHNPLWVEHLLQENGSIRVEQAEENQSGTESYFPQATFSEPTDTNKEISATATEIVGQNATAPETVQSDPEPLLIEPYHTVDYFASQGIKLKDEEKPVRKFDQQLRSFTEWLKSMKRLPVSGTITTINPEAEIVVEAMAESSLKDDDVYTEAMAEVWVKQGNLEKAIEIYRKLSLLDHSKSAYFASKIEALKKSN